MKIDPRVQADLKALEVRLQELIKKWKAKQFPIAHDPVSLITFGFYQGVTVASKIATDRLNKERDENS